VEAAEGMGSMTPLTRNHFIEQVALWGHASVLVNVEGIVAVARHESPEGTWIHPQLGVRLTYHLGGLTFEEELVPPASSTPGPPWLLEQHDTVLALKERGAEIIFSFSPPTDEEE
jgi:hypothetical protein